MSPNQASPPLTNPRKGIAPHPQATRILSKFGGPLRLAHILSEIGRPKDPTTIYKWTYSTEKGGTGGLIPTKAWEDILAAARFEGILITSEDMDPRNR